MNDRVGPLDYLDWAAEAQRRREARAYEQEQRTPAHELTYAMVRHRLLADYNAHLQTASKLLHGQEIARRLNEAHAAMIAAEESERMVMWNMPAA